MKDDALTERVIGLAINVHKQLGPGLLESVYERCLAYELGEAGLQVRCQVPIYVQYGPITFEDAFRADLIVENELLLELKCVEKIAPVHKAQVITYLRLGGFARGLLLNFNSVRLVEGLCRLFPNERPLISSFPHC